VLPDQLDHGRRIERAVLQLTVADTAQLLLGASMIGVVDVFWFHYYRFRLFRQSSAAAEEAVHLLSYATFVAIGIALLAVGADGSGRSLVLALFGVQVMLTAADVLLEPRSRKALGGLPAVEYLFHILVTFGMGAAATTFWWSTRSGEVAPLSGMARTQVLTSIGFTSALLAVETGLSLNALHRRNRKLHKVSVVA
jgi:hypothetical protein